MGQYLVGFDTIGYYVPNTLDWLRGGISFTSLLSSAPLIYLLLMGIVSTGAPIVLSLKIIAPLLLGLLGFSVYQYANKALVWSNKKSLAVAVVSTLYFVALRISWDMLRTELASIFLFMTLILLQKNGQSVKKGLLLGLTMALVVLSHQLVAIIMFAVILATVVSLFLKKKIANAGSLILSAVPAILLLLSIIYINYFVFASPIIGFSSNYSGGFETLTSFSHLSLIGDTLGFLAFCYLPLLPFLVFGIKHLRNNIHLAAWIIWALVPVLVIIFSPDFFIGGVLPYRWIMLLVYPLSFFAVEGLSRVKWAWYKVAVCALLVIFSVSFMVLPNNVAFPYYDNYSTYIPKTMLQNTVQLSDCQGTANALTWAQRNMPSNGHLLVHAAFYGWADLTISSSQLIPYYFANVTDAAKTAAENSPSNPLYLIWWVNGSGWYGQSTLPSSFDEVYHSGNMAIYKYSATA